MAVGMCIGAAIGGVAMCILAFTGNILWGGVCLGGGLIGGMLIGLAVPKKK